MTKTSSKDPYAFNGSPLTKEQPQANTDVLSNEKDTAYKARKQFYIESYVCL